MSHPRRYVVTAGTHDEYAIRGVFDTEQQAIDWILSGAGQPTDDEHYVPRIEVWAGPEDYTPEGDAHPQMTTVYFASIQQSRYRGGEEQIIVREVSQFTPPIPAQRIGKKIAGTDKEEVLDLLREQLEQKARQRIEDMLRSVK